MTWSYRLKSFQRKTYKVNDTIRIYIVVHNNSMYDQRTGQWVDIHCSDVPIYVYAGVREENYIRRILQLCLTLS